MSRLPNAWPASSPDAKRCSRASPSGDGSGSSAPMQRRRSPGAGMPRQLAQPAARAAVVGDRDHRRQLARVAPAAERLGEPVAAADRDHLRASRAGGRLAHQFDVPVVHRRVHSHAGGSARRSPRRARPSGAGRPCNRWRSRGRTCPRGRRRAARARTGRPGGRGTPWSPRCRARSRAPARRGRSAVAQLDPVRVGQEAAVEDEVDVERDAVLEAERDDRGLHAAVASTPSTSSIRRSRSSCTFRSLVSTTTSASSRSTSSIARSCWMAASTLVGLDRVAPAGALVASDEHLVGGVQEDDAHARSGRAQRRISGASSAMPS